MHALRFNVSLFIYIFIIPLSGILDTYYKPKMSDEEAMSLGRRAIMHATYRDAGSGGVCNRELLDGWDLEAPGLRKSL